MNRTVCGITVLVILLMSFLASTVDSRASAQYSQRNPYPRFGEQNVTISFSTPHCTKIGQYDWLEMENCSFVTNQGQPMLPIRTVVMKLPERSSILDVSVTVREAQLEGIFSVLPAPSPSIVGSQPPGDSSEDATIYASKSFFPDKWYTFREGHGLDAETNTRVEYVILSLFPLRFLPAEKRVIRAMTVSVKVSYVEALPLTTPSLFKNLIITSPDFETYALQLARWKNQTGVSSRVVNTTWIYHNYGGIDRQEQIRACIKDFVARYGILYVTIFGDADVVPVRYVYVPDGQDTYTPTDLYYGDLDGTWDDNNDGLYADQRYDSVDGIPDVYVGRIPYSLASYAQAAVDKIIGYQSQFNASQSWTRRVVLAAGTGSGDGFSNTLGNASAVLKEYISDIVSDRIIVKLYESAGNLTQGNMLNQINNGALFVNFAGHGDPDTGLFSAGWLFYWIIPGLIWNGFGISEVQSLSNGLKLPVVTTMSCSTARFDDMDCLGEWFVGEPHGGSIAYFGATRIAWCYVNGGSPYGLMGEMDWRIYQNYYEGFTRLGQMWGETVSEYVQSHVWNYEYASVYDVKTFMEFELLGDPTIRIYHPDYPETLNVPEGCATIQGAINAAYDGDTILVSSGTYYENLNVSKSVSLIGENRSSTIIDGNLAGNVVRVMASSVTVNGFTVRRSSSTWPNHRGIYVSSGSTGNNVSGNIITDNVFGIYLDFSSNNCISGNNIANNTYGIELYSSPNVSIIGNVITNNIFGVYSAYSSNNSIYHNNFVGNMQQAYSYASANVWDEDYPSGGNYWSDYAGADANQDGIGDTPYVIDANNGDRYPLMNSYPGFSNGFESGSFSFWNGTSVSSGETATVVDSLSHHGTYSGKFATNGGTGNEAASCYRSVSSLSELYAREYLYVSASGIVENDDRFSSVGFKAGSNLVASAGWRRMGGMLKWSLLVRHGTSYAVVYSTASPALGKWYCVELHWKQDSVNGLGELWVDGVKVCVATGKNTANYGSVNRVEFGLSGLVGCASTTVYSDCTRISNEYIGLEAPPSFPMFSDGFESGSFSAWSLPTLTTGETRNVAGATVHHGSYAGQFASDGTGGTERAYVYEAVSSTSELYACAYVRVSTSGIAENGDRFFPIIFKAGGTSVAFAGWQKTGGVVKWNLIIRHGTGWVNVFSSITPAPNQWYCVELHWKKDAVNGLGELWVDGVKVCSASGRNTANYGDINQVQVGLPEIINCGSTQAYIDCAVISAAYIGPESGPVQATVHLASTLEEYGYDDNVGSIILDGVAYTLPNDVLKILGTYSVTYTAVYPDYKFGYWETSGGISVANTTSETTTVTVSGAGTLNAVFQVTYLGYRFQDGFESGSFSAWNLPTSTVGETRNVVNTVVHSGTYAGQFASSGNGGTERSYVFTTDENLWLEYVEGSFMVASSGLVENGDRFYMIAMKAGSNVVAFAGWRMVNGVVKWNLIIRDGTSWVSVYSIVSPSLNQWYSIRLEWLASSTGYGKLFVDDVLVCSAINKNTEYYGFEANRFEIGLPELVNCGVTQIYADDFGIIVRSGPS